MTTRQPAHQIVVGIDGTEAGLRAAEYAAHEAQERGALLLLVHAYHVAVGLNPMSPWYGMNALRQSGELALREASQTVMTTAGSVQPRTCLVAGSAAGALVDASRTAALVVVARRELHGIQRVVSGSTSTAVAARSHAPVVSIPAGWTHPPATPGTRDKVVVGVDGSTAGRDAIAHAFAEASRRSADLVAVHCWEVPAYWFSDSTLLESDLVEWEQLARLSMAENLAGWQADFPDVTVTTCIEKARRPADALIEHSKEALLLVVGARGAGGLPGLHLGWTSHVLLQHAHCPLAVVHHADTQVSETHREAASSRL